jgi:hypothetical protein
MRTFFQTLFRCTVLVGLTILFADCSSSKWKCAAIVNRDGKAEFVSTMVGEAALDEAPKFGWLPGRVVLFRETTDLSIVNSKLPSSTSGKAGEVYRIDSEYRLQKIAEFDPTLANSELLKKYGELCEPSLQEEE